MGHVGSQISVKLKAHWKQSLQFVFESVLFVLLKRDVWLAF